MPTDPETLRDDVLIGAQQIADEIGIEIRQCFHWLQHGYIPATKTGHIWTSTRSRLRQHFNGDGRTAAANAISAQAVS